MRNFLVKFKFFYLLTKRCVSEQVTISRDPRTRFCSFLALWSFRPQEILCVVKICIAPD
jgi:hypothetical protein